MSLVTIVGPILLIGAIFLIIFIYKLIYKQNMNKALQGEATTGLIDIGSLLKTLSIIALLIMNVIALTKITDLNYQISAVESNLGNQITNLNYRISNINSEMEEYYQSLELVQQSQKELVDIDIANDEYTYEIEFTLLEKEVDAEVYLVVEKNGLSNNILLTSTSLTYQHTLVLEYDTDLYSISVLLEGTTLIQKDLFDIDVERDSSYIVSHGLSFIDGRELFGVIVFVHQELNYINDLTVEEVTFKITNDGVVTETITIDSLVSMDTLLAPYQDEGNDFNEIPEGNLFAIVIDSVDFSGEMNIEMTITLTNGTQLVRNLEF